MSSFTLPALSVTHASKTTAPNSKGVTVDSGSSPQSIDFKPDSSGFFRELRTALDAVSAIGSTAPLVAPTAIDGLPEGGSELPQTGNALPLPMLPGELSEPDPAAIGFGWRFNPAPALDAALSNAPGTADATLGAGASPLATQAVAAEAGLPPPVSAAVRSGSGDVADAGSPAHRTGTAALSMSPTDGGSLAPVAAETVRIGRAAMPGMGADTLPTDAGLSNAAPSQLGLSADGLGVDGLSAKAGEIGVVPAAAGAAVPAPPPGAQPAATAQHTIPMGLSVSAALVAGGPDWSEALAQRIGWMLEGQLGRAEIAIDPPELGPLQVRITTLHDQTQVQFLSQNAAVRDALDQALPRLREMLEAQGLQLAHADVSDRQHNEGRRHSAAALLSEGGDAEENGPARVQDSPGLTTPIGLIDAYA